jgi:molecular chaperone HscB
MDYFEVFGLPRKLGIDTAALQRRFYELAREHHPDFHQSATPEQLARAEEASALVNAAYRALRDPLTRAEYLVRLEEGRDTKEGAAGKPKAPPELLAEMFEIQEALSEARDGGLDDRGRAALAEQRAHLAARQAAEEERVRGALSGAWDAAPAADRPAVLARIKAALAARAYLRTVIDDLAQALGEGDERVAHHRH